MKHDPSSTPVTTEGHHVPAAPGYTRAALTAKGIFGVVLAVALITIPYTNDPFRVEQFATVAALAVAAMGLNLLTGFNGQISIGHGAFYGIGAYTTAILVQDHGWNHFLTIPVAIVLTFVVGVVVGLPALRIKGLYLALVTLAVATLFPQLVNKFDGLTGGTTGIVVTNNLTSPDSGVLADDQYRFFVVVAIAAIVFVLVRNLVNSRVGRSLIAIRDNETAAEVLGVNLASSKVITFGISAALAGLGGTLSVMARGTAVVSPNVYNVNLSIELLVAVVVGGVATIFGPAIGALVIEFLPEFLPDGTPEQKQLTPLIFGAALIALMMVAPGGLLGLGRQIWASVQRRVRGRGGGTPTERENPLASGAAAPAAGGG